MCQFILTVEDEIGLSHSCLMFVSAIDMIAPKITMIGFCKPDVGDTNARLN